MFFENISDFICEVRQIRAIDDGKESILMRGEEAFSRAEYEWKNTLKDCREMPAFGVSINDLTVQATGSGLWAEFYFDGVSFHNEMPFERLLVQVNDGATGFNLHRYNAPQGYSGRCFYLDLEEGKTLSEFAKALKTLISKKESGIYPDSRFSVRFAGLASARSVAKVFVYRGV